MGRGGSLGEDTGPRVLSFRPGPLQPAAGRKGRAQRGEGQPPNGLGAGSEKLLHGRAPSPLRSLPLSLPALPAWACLPVSAAASRRQRSSRPRYVPAGPEARRLPAAPARCSGQPHPGGEWHSCPSRSAVHWEAPNPRAMGSFLWAQPALSAARYAPTKARERSGLSAPAGQVAGGGPGFRDLHSVRWAWREPDGGAGVGKSWWVRPESNLGMTGD